MTATSGPPSTLPPPSSYGRRHRSPRRRRLRPRAPPREPDLDPGRNGICSGGTDGAPPPSEVLPLPLPVAASDRRPVAFGDVRVESVNIRWIHTHIAPGCVWPPAAAAGRAFILKRQQERRARAALIEIEIRRTRDRSLLSPRTGPSQDTGAHIRVLFVSYPSRDRSSNLHLIQFTGALDRSIDRLGAGLDSPGHARPIGLSVSRSEGTSDKRRERHLRHRPDLNTGLDAGAARAPAAQGIRQSRAMQHEAVERAARWRLPRTVAVLSH